MTTQKNLTFAFQALLVVYGVMFFTFDRMLNLLPIVLLLASFVFIARQGITELQRMSKEECLLYTALFLYFLSFLLSFFIHAERFYLLEQPAKFMFFSLIIFLLARISFRIEFFWAMIALASISNAFYALGVGRVNFEGRLTTDIFEHPLYYGNVSLLFAFVSLAGTIWAQGLQAKAKWIWSVILITGFISGLMISVLSGTRGGWVAIPFALFFVLYHFAKLYKKQCLLYSGTVAFVLLMTLFILFFDTPFQQRIWLTINSLQSYFLEDNPNTSIGLRFEMWQVGWRLFIENPLFGFGEVNYVPELQRLINEGIVTSELIHYKHLHNQYIQALAFHGVIGFVALILVMGVLLRFFSKRLFAGNLEVKSLAVAGAVSVFLYLDFFLSITMLHLNQSTMPFLILVALMVGKLLSLSRIPHNDVKELRGRL